MTRRKIPKKLATASLKAAIVKGDSSVRELVVRKRGGQRRARAEFEQDLIIGRAAEQLLGWGVPRRVACQALAKPAAAILLRTDAYGKALSADRIEQFLEAWQASLNGRFRSRDAVRPALARASFTAQSLRARRPRRSVEELATILLQHGGRWPQDPDDKIGVGDALLTPRGADRVAGMPRFARKTG